MFKKKNQNSLYLVMIQNYLFFALCIGALIGLLLLAVYFTEYWYQPQTDVEALLSKKELLIKEKYKELNTIRYLGKNGYIEVLDETAHVIYSERENAHNRYDKEILNLIPDVGEEKEWVYAEKIYGNHKKDGYVLRKYVVSTGEEDAAFIGEEGAALSGIAVLDKEGNILYSDLELPFSSFTMEQLNYISGIRNDATVLQKYAFRTSQGEKRWMMLYISQDYREYFRLMERATTVVFAVFILFLIVFLLVFAFRLSIRVRRPLKLLQEALDEFSAGRQIAESQFNIREFYEISSAFNHMSESLKESENGRLQLEYERQKMLADISHDLKTPLTVIQGYARALEQNLVKPEEQKKYLSTISRKAEVLTELLKSFYEYSMVEDPRFSFTFEEADICDYLREYLADKYEELTLAGFFMDIDLPEDKVMYRFDKVQLKRVFENLISNSVRHNKARTTIFVSLKAEKQLVIQIGDDGSGIPDDLTDCIFEPFVTGNEARTSGTGTGLGLSVVKKIVEAHGGSVHLWNKAIAGKGVLFELSFGSSKKDILLKKE